jgi:peptide/nickel transport system substrate-binding protein
MKGRPFWMALVLSALFVALVAGYTTTSAPAAKENVLTIGTSEDAITLDPQASTRWLDTEIFDNIYDRLVTRDKDQKIVPQLATSYKAVDPLTWEFKLRQGVKFANGEPFDANSVKVTIEKILDRNEKLVNLTAFYAGVDKVQVVDDLTVRIITKTPDPLLPGRLSGYGGLIIPPKYLAQVGRKDFAIKPNGTGPYELDSWVKDQQVVLVRNENYWGPKPPFDRVIWKPIPEPGARVAALLKGEVDMILPTPIDQVDAIQKARMKVNTGPAGMNALWAMCYDNCAAPILKTTKFRQAMNLAINRASIVKNLYRGLALVPNGYILSTDFGYDAKLPPLEYNPTKAKQLMTEAGYKGEQIVMYTTVSDYVPNDKMLAESVADMLKQVGINVDLRTFDTATRGTMFTNKTSPGLMIGNPSSPFLDPVGHFWRQLKPGGYYNHGYAADHKGFIDTMTAAEQEMDNQKRAALYQKANQYLINDPPWLMVIQQMNVTAEGPKAANWFPRPDLEVYMSDFAPAK